MEKTKMPFHRDTFTDANGTALTPHTTDVGPGCEDPAYRGSDLIVAGAATIEGDGAKISANNCDAVSNADQADVDVSVDTAFGGDGGESPLLAVLMAHYQRSGNQ